MQTEINLLIITGLSGAGKSVTIDALEDIGFFCVDNLPPALIPKFGDLIVQSQGKVTKVGLVCDMRGGDFFNTVFDALQELEQKGGVNYQIVFLEADDSTIVRRFKETRRRHPLAKDGRVVEGIHEEREMLEEIRGKADLIINTTNLKASALRQQIVERFSHIDQQHMKVDIMSFGFKHGVPIEADMIFDVRFLPNPHYVDHLRPLTGRDQDVYDYVMKWPITHAFANKLTDMVDFLLPQFRKEGKTQLVIGIGCTGGKHRSVALAEYLHEHIKDREWTTVVHRDSEKS
ncbi:RNase adapter RapZ [Tumebacillus sp. ITR2]|uniref:RNase adapter RapZ n=1 Tax=Tumebacillus amylolyticus TaxID=2801339 RepID=A0ABS1J9C6_9BACL|nr:RNase adapter RapZ [Tumebacillus amylolyticus]MBL0386875.1 RNase adapter RapZ [Tumebacillus amylolyticus]